MNRLYDITWFGVADYEKRKQYLIRLYKYNLFKYFL